MLLAETMEMLTSGEYSLTKKNVVHARKSILFVKLTDSAQRALSNYLRNVNTCEVPIIEFNNDEGRLSIPTSPKSSAETDQYMAQFKFDVISNDTMQGKQGRFECVQHKRGSKQLIRFGQLTQRLRIHANEDVYETTKNRMAAIELQQRKNCTVQLDWNSATKTSNLNRKMKLTSKGFLTIKSDETTKPVPKFEISNMIRNKSRPVNNAPPKKINPASCIIRKPLKERIIHLLAVRPYKKPELEAALKRDGLRDCDKSHIMDTLMSVSTFRDNAYHLSKHAWNDVQEDWLFYSEHERQQIKKNKQQNLTSPSSSSDSGVSVGSNQSPNNNTQVGGDKTPPHSYKRPGYFNGVDGLQTKRQRISHFVKQEPIRTSNAPFFATTTLSSILASSGGSGNSGNSNNFDDHLSQLVHRSDDYPKTAVAKQEFKPSPTKNFSTNSSSVAAISTAAAATDVRSTLQAENKYSPLKEQPPSIGSNFAPAVSSPSDFHSVVANGSDDEMKPTMQTHIYPHHQQQQFECDRTQQQQQQQMAGASSVAATNAAVATPAVDVNSRAALDKKHQYEKPKYMKDYVTITNTEQRSRYKADFSKIFEEYERVHKEVDHVRNLFAQLGESLKKHKKGSKGYVKVETDIFRKYYALKSNRNFQDAKRRYEYLHEKLSHIKNLVNEYDDKVRKQIM